MADTVQLGAPVGTGAVVATDDAGAAGQVQIIKLAIGADGSATVIPADATVGLRVDPAGVSVADGGTLPAKGVQVGGTDGSVFQVLSTDNAGRLNANINGTVPVSGPLTDTQLRASAVPVSGTVTASGPLTDTQLRASAVPVDTELPAAAALADAAANPTAPATGGFGMLWNGATWDRAPGSAAGGATTNLKQLNGTTIATNSGNKDAGTQRVVIATDQVQLTNALKVDGSAVTQPVSLATLPVTNAGTFVVQDSEKVADDAAFTVATTKLTPVGMLADQTSTDSVNEGDIGAPRITLDRKQIVTLAPSADTEGLTVANNIDVDETEDAVKASAGKLYGWAFYNDGATEVYLKYYNDTVANVVVGTTVPFMTFPIPAGSASNIEFSHGIAFSAAITIAATTAAATADTGAPATNQLVGFSVYQ